MSSPGVLLRIGQVIEALFYTHRETFFENVIERVEERDGNLLVFHGGYPPATWVPQFHPLPVGIFTNEQDRRAVLAHLCCRSSLALMYETINHLLTGHVTLIKEVTLNIKDSGYARNTIYVCKERGEDKTVYVHDVLVIEAPGGSQHVVDVTCAQHGYHAPIVECKKFFERVESVPHSETQPNWRDFGTERKEYEGRAKAETATGGIQWGFKLEAADSLMKGLLRWEGSGEVSVQQMVTFEEEPFRQKLVELIRFVEQYLKEDLESLLKKATEQGMAVMARQQEQP